MNSATSGNCSVPLNRIAIMVRQRARHEVGPAWHRAMNGAMATSVLFIVSLIVASVARWEALLGWDAYIIGFAVVGVTAIAAYYTTPHKTWTEAIFNALAVYEPACGVAYRDLQRAVKEKGLNDYELASWLIAEHAAAGVAVRWPVDPTKPNDARDRINAGRSRFLDRTIQR